MTHKALVESHKYHAAESIDDVIQGKGKGLVGKLTFPGSSLGIADQHSRPPRPSRYWQDSHRGRHQ